MAERDERLGRLAGFPDVVAAAARSAGGRPTPEGEWTPEQVARHLIAVDIEVHQRRLDVREPHFQQRAVAVLALA